MNYSNIGIRAQGRVGPTGDFPVADAEHIFVPVDNNLMPIEVTQNSDGNLQTPQNGLRLDEVLFDAFKRILKNEDSISAITPKIKTESLDSVLEPNTQYFLSTKKTSVTLTFPSTASHGDSIYVQFVSGNSIVVSLKDQSDIGNVRINSTSYKANSVIEIHALYCYIKENISVWNAILHVRGVP